MDVSDIASQLGKLGGKKSAQVRFAGKTKEEISAIMRAVRVVSAPKGIGKDREES